MLYIFQYDVQFQRIHNIGFCQFLNALKGLPAITHSVAHTATISYGVDFAQRGEFATRICDAFCERKDMCS